MKQLIRLTGSRRGGSVWIDPEKILVIDASGGDTYLMLVGAENVTVWVNETPAEIIDLLTRSGWFD